MNPGAPTLRHNPAPPTTPIHAACAAMSARPQSCAICPRSTDLPLPGPLPSIQTVPAPSKERLSKEPTSITTEPATAVPPQTSPGQQPRSIRPGKGEGEVRQQPPPSPPKHLFRPIPATVTAQREATDSRSSDEGGRRASTTATAKEGSRNSPPAPHAAVHSREGRPTAPRSPHAPPPPSATPQALPPLCTAVPAAPRPCCSQPPPPEPDPAGCDRSPPARTT